MPDPARARRLAKRISTIVASAIEFEIKDPRLVSSVPPTLMPSVGQGKPADKASGGPAVAFAQTASPKLNVDLGWFVVQS